MITPDETKEKQAKLLSYIRSRKISVSMHNSNTSFLEGVFSRGDRRLSRVIETAWKAGCKFDSWDDSLKFDVWMQCFEKCGVDPYFYTARKREYDEILPWDHMDYGVTKQFFIKENQKAHKGVTTPCCREKCAGCGAAAINGGECSEIRKSVV